MIAREGLLRPSGGCLQVAPRRRQRQRPVRSLHVKAFWTSNDKDGTDDEILTAAAVSEQGKGRSMWRNNQAKQGVPPPGEEPPPPRSGVSLPAFSVSLAIITAGSFFIGSLMRRYILQPDEDSSSGSASKGRSGWRRGSFRNGAGGGGGAPSVQDLLDQRGGSGSLATGDSVFSSAAVLASQDQAAATAEAAEAALAAAAAAAGSSSSSGGSAASAGTRNRSAAAGVPAPAAAAGPAGGVEAASSLAQRRANIPPVAQVTGRVRQPKAAATGTPPPTAGAQQQQAPAAAAAAAAAATQQAEAAAAAAAAATQQQQQQQEASQASVPGVVTSEPQQAAVPQQAQRAEQPPARPDLGVAGNTWCEETLGPALEAADGQHAQQEPPAQQAPPAQQQAPPQAQQQAGGDAWCEETLVPAVEAAAVAAATEAAAPLLACPRVWVLCRPVQGGSVALRLLFPLPGGQEEHCVALLEARADAEAAQILLEQLMGIPTVVQQFPTAQMAGDAGRRRWGAAFYSAGSLAGELAVVAEAATAQAEAEAAAAAQGQQAAAAEGEQEEEEVAMGQQEVEEQQKGKEQQKGQGQEEGQGESAAVGEASAPEGEQQAGPDAAAMLYSVLQQRALLLSGEQMAAVAGRLQGQATAATGGSDGSSAAAATSATPAAAADVAAQQAQQQQAQPVSGAADAWDPASEKVPRRLDNATWWLQLPVLHVPQMVYSGGMKGLMTVPISAPATAPDSNDRGSAGNTSNAGAGAGGSSGQGSGSSGQDSGSSGQGREATRVERRLVAFADLKDAEALIECSLQAGTGAAEIQIVSVPPAQLAQHATTNGCGVSALPSGELSLPAGAGYDEAVAAVVAAVERQYTAQLMMSGTQRS